MTIRKAKKEDLPAIIKMFSNDKLGKSRETYNEPLPETYYSAFERISADAFQDVYVAEMDSEGVIATLQMSYIQYLNYEGGLRAQIESVHVRDDQQGKGVGQRFLKWAIEQANKHGAKLVQLTSDKLRPDAIHFYEKLGFRSSHEGMKLRL